jgi:hypothetical protein
MMNLVQSYDIGVSDMKRHQRSTGELISSVAFFGAALWLVFEANNLFASDYHVKAVLVYLGAFLTFLASIRFAIQSLVLKVVRVIWPK